MGEFELNIIIYPGSDESIMHFRDFCHINSIKMSEEKDEIGNKLIIEDKLLDKEQLVHCITLYITEVYLERYIFCKIYDEYPSIDPIAASKILSKFIEQFSKSFVKEKFQQCISKSNMINIPSLMLFNIKQIMLTTNLIVDSLCENHLLLNEFDVSNLPFSTYNAPLRREIDELFYFGKSETDKIVFEKKDLKGDINQIE